MRVILHFKFTNTITTESYLSLKLYDRYFNFLKVSPILKNSDHSYNDQYELELQ